MHVPLSERLDLLRAIDSARRWESMDDERVCLLCARKFTGRHLDFRQRADGRIEVRCPTDGCNATARQWVYADDPRVILRASERSPFFGLSAAA